jgi:UDP-glucose:(heptosyl)LPS alpha-1,3-glucosyltransferase
VKIAIAYHRHAWDRGIERKSAELAERFARAGQSVGYVCAFAEPRPGTDVMFVRVPVRGGPTSLQLGTFNFLARRTLRRMPHELSLSFGSVIGCDILVAESCHRAGLRAMALHREEIEREGRNLGLADAVRLRIERANYSGRKYLQIVACSSSVERELRNEYGVPESDVTVIPSGVDTVAFAPESNASEAHKLRSSLGYSSEDRILLFVGDEFARKGLRTVIQALALLPDERVHLLVCGGGAASVYKRLAVKLGVAHRVRFQGHVASVAPYFAASDIFVLPTLHEAFGLVILEAMAAALPVIVSAGAGAAEDHLTDGKDGFLLHRPTDPAELAGAIGGILERPDCGRALGEAGRRRASALTWDACAKRYLDLFSETAARKSTEAMESR